MKVKETRISTAGVFRCCLASLDEDYAERQDEDVEIGTRHECSACDDVMTLCSDGTWRGSAAFVIWGPANL